MRDILKNCIATVLFKTGVLFLVHRLLYRQRAVILMYHRVLPSLPTGLDYVQPGMFVTVETFRRHANLLKKRFEVVSLAEIFSRLHTGKSVAGCCAITFDDGWLDNFSHAFGVLEESNLPATVFLASGFIGSNNCFWPEQLSFHLRQSGINKEGMQGGIYEKLSNEVPPTADEAVYLDNAIMALKNWSPKERDELLASFHASAKSPAPPRLLMNWDEVLTMHQSGLVDFGSHTANHIILDQVPLDMAREEIVHSRDEIEAHLGVPVTLFAYPNGNYNASLRKIVTDSGYIGAVTTKSGWISRNKNLFSLPRIGLHEDVCNTRARFYARLILQKF
ncbi:MAG: polysaccharide deacetylase family protein [Desulfobulbaceae bacterium]|nr:MAG: polysaccharide deacetylase family protein [Desulfobulbaceae bacterium]